MNTQDDARTIDPGQVGASRAIPPAPRARRGLPRAAVVGGLFVAAAGAFVAAVLLPVQPARTAPPWWLFVLPVVTLFAVLALLRSAERRTTGRVVAVVAGVGAVLAGRAALADVSSGLPTRVFPLLAGAFLAVLAGSLLLAREADHQRPSRARVAVAGLVVALVTGAAMLGVSEVAVRAPVQASTADSAADEVTATVPTGVRWSYDLPGDQGVAPYDGVVAAGSGAAVLLEDGVVAVDGVTGAVRWAYRRDGARAVEVAASPGGERVAVVLESGADGERGTRLVVLDGETGEVGADLVGFEQAPFGLVMTGRVLVSGGDGSLTGRSVADGSTSWTWRAPAGCTVRGAAAGADTAMAVLFCPEPDRTDGVARGTVRVVGLDDATGEQRWVHEDQLEVPIEVPLPEGAPSLSLTGPLLLPGTGGTAVRVQWAIEAPAAGPDSRLDVREFVLAVDDGRVLVGDTALDATGSPLTYDERATVALVPGPDGGSYTRLPADGSAARTVPTAIGAGAQVADLGDALVQLGAAEGGPGRMQLVVTPWDGSSVSRLTVDVGPPAYSGGDPGLQQLPGVLVVVVPGSTQVVGVG